MSAQRRLTLEDVERAARAALSKGGPDVAIDWAFKHARAVARLAEAEQAWKSFDSDRYRLILDMSDKLTKPDEFQALTYATASLHAAAADLGEARAIEVACAHVTRLLDRRSGTVSPVIPARSPQPKAA